MAGLLVVVAALFPKVLRRKPLQAAESPSKPWDCGSRRCRRGKSRLSGSGSVTTRRLRPVLLSQKDVERSCAVSFGGTGDPSLARLPWQLSEAARQSLQQSPPIPPAPRRCPAPPADWGAQPEQRAVSRPYPWLRP